MMVVMMATDVDDKSMRPERKRGPTWPHMLWSNPHGPNWININFINKSNDMKTAARVGHTREQL